MALFKCSSPSHEPALTAATRRDSGIYHPNTSTPGKQNIEAFLGPGVSAPRSCAEIEAAVQVERSWGRPEELHLI